MGMYTEVFFRAEVDDEAWLAFQAIEAGEDPSPMPDHPFFRKPRWSHLFHGGSYYFPGANHFTIYDDRPVRAKYVSFRGNLKDYDDEIAAFFDWVRPHVVQHQGFVGYSLYEEDRAPTLYYADAQSA